MSYLEEQNTLITRYGEFSPLESRDKPMIVDLEQQITVVNKKQIQQLATQLNTIHEQYRLYTDKTNQLDEGYETSRTLKANIKAAESDSLAQNKSYLDLLNNSHNTQWYTKLMFIMNIIIFITILTVVMWLC